MKIISAIVFLITVLLATTPSYGHDQLLVGTVSAKDYRNFWIQWLGDSSTIIAYTVPSDKLFVLTDIYGTTPATNSVGIWETNSLKADMIFSDEGKSYHFISGIVFASDTEIRLIPTSSVTGSMTLTGYLY